MATTAMVIIEAVDVDIMDRAEEAIIVDVGVGATDEVASATIETGQMKNMKRGQRVTPRKKRILKK